MAIALLLSIHHFLTDALPSQAAVHFTLVFAVVNCLCEDTTCRFKTTLFSANGSRVGEGGRRLVLTTVVEIEWSIITLLALPTFTLYCINCNN